MYAASRHAYGTLWKKRYRYFFGHREPINYGSIHGVVIRSRYTIHDGLSGTQFQHLAAISVNAGLIFRYVVFLNYHYTRSRYIICAVSGSMIMTLTLAMSCVSLSAIHADVHLFHTNIR